MPLKKTPLPLVEMVCSCFPKQDLSSVRIIGIQNLLPTTFRMFLSLFARGLNPVNVTLVGKCYSTSPEVVNAFKELGCNIAPLSTVFEAQKPYDIALRGYLETFFQHRICSEDFSSYSKVIIMDDGGTFLEKIQAQNYFPLSNLVGIEQTSFGYHKLQSKPLLLPIVNVGRSEIKLKYEAPLIAWTVVRKLKERLLSLSSLPETLAIIGSGPVGNAVFDFLKKRQQFSITHIKNSEEIKNFHGKWAEFDMIIGCTGKTLFQPQDFTGLKSSVILVSASYSDTEFSAAYLREKVSNITSCHQDIVVEGVRLLNCGFPVNFDDHYDTVDPEAFQLTRSLLTTALYQGLKISFEKNKWVDLSHQVQKKIENSILNDPLFQKILSYNLE